MIQHYRKPELVALGGNMGKLKIAAMLGAHMTGRSANLGDCAHSYRRKYSLKRDPPN
ncbi:MAG: hypothetical protein ACUZ8H_11540 [Candidatus Anammoxibacter sp.]